MKVARWLFTSHDRRSCGCGGGRNAERVRRLRWIHDEHAAPLRDANNAVEARLLRIEQATPASILLLHLSLIFVAATTLAQQRRRPPCCGEETPPFLDTACVGGPPFFAELKLCISFLLVRM